MPNEPLRTAEQHNALPHPLHALGYSEAEVKQILFERFDAWMQGQTMALDESDQPLYYRQDVRRYLGMCPRVHQGVVD